MGGIKMGGIKMGGIKMGGNYYSPYFFTSLLC
jgi:hypothetical protein